MIFKTISKFFTFFVKLMLGKVGVVKFKKLRIKIGILYEFGFNVICGNRDGRWHQIRKLFVTHIKLIRVEIEIIVAIIQ